MTDWISVKERLPENDAIGVWVYDGREVMPATYYRTIKEHEHFPYCLARDVFRNRAGIQIVGVTDWAPMELPAPPPRKWTKDEALRIAIKAIETFHPAEIRLPVLGGEATLLPKLKEALEA